MLQICYAITKSTEEAERVWWDMPLSKVWAYLHCELISLGQTVIYSSTLANVKKYLAKRSDDTSQGKRPAYEQNLDETKYSR